ncbi:transcriptional regulator [Streptomyces olivochromogenes]|uniref:Transcriptional regulator n=1 Tax=Streptomyces olivochromogenes TaxID=1963 RepID=A0A250VUY7_STROL|nr:transcriptional regulator [Streptomyces olivochromogenes]
MSNAISGGVFFQQVIQGRDITVMLPPKVPPALSGLPAPSPAFTGRQAHVEELLRELVPREERQQATAVAPQPSRMAVAGLAGVGKTELVVQVAVRALREPGWFPGGVLFVDLFGYDPERRLSPERALDGFLRALGIPGEHIPNGLHDRQRLYRSVLAAFVEQGQRILVVIDNASSADQAASLLPTDGMTAALITSRHTLDIDARLHDLNVLDTDASIALLHQALLQSRGPTETRVQDAPEAATAIADLCAGLPLALRIAAALLADTPTRPLASLAQALQAEHSRLDRLRREDRAVRAAFDLSYEHLSNASVRLFRLFPINAGSDLSTESTAALADLDVFTAEELLQDLNRAHLIETSGSVWGRWRMHDLIRLYADGHSRAGEHRAERAAGIERLYAHYLAITQDADTYLGPQRLAQPSACFAGRTAALEWLEWEMSNLVEAATSALEAGQPLAGIGLAMALDSYLERCRAFPEAVAVHEASLACAVRLDSLEGRAKSLNNLGIAYNEVGRNEEAMAAFTHAARLCAKLGNHSERGKILNGLGTVLRETGHPAKAVQVHQEALSLQQQLGDVAEQAAVLNNLSLDHQDLNAHFQALENAREAAGLFGQLGDGKQEGTALCTMALALDELGRPHDAVQKCDCAINAFRVSDDAHQEGTALLTKAQILAFSLGRFEDAVSCWTQAVTVFERTNERILQVKAFTLLGLALASLNRQTHAISMLKEAVRLATTLGLAEELNEAQTSLDMIRAS